MNKEMMDFILNFVADILLVILGATQQILSQILEVVKVIIEIFSGIMEGKLIKSEAFLYFLTWFVLCVVGITSTAGALFWVAIHATLPIFAVFILVTLGLFCFGLIMYTWNKIQEELEKTSYFGIQLKYILTKISKSAVNAILIQPHGILKRKVF